MEPLIFEWDPEKSERNRVLRGLDFETSARIFGGRVVEWEDGRRDSGETDGRGRKGRRRFRNGRLHRSKRQKTDHRIMAGKSEGSRTMVRMTLEQIMASPSKVDRAIFDATTEEDIRRCQIEDGYDPDWEPGEVVPIVPAQVVRRQLGMTQEAFAKALHIPLATLRNWEQGRTRPDPAAQSLLRAVARDPKAVLAAIAG